MKNIVGSSSRYFDINVLTQPVIREAKHVETIQVEAGGELSVSCVITGGNPEPAIFWRLQSTTIGVMNETVASGQEQLISRQNRFVLSPDSQSLTISDLSVDDSGELICTAINDAGHDRKL